MQMRMYLGPFELHEPAGNGAMGEVWRATHRAQGMPVAVKVVTGSIREMPMFQTRFAHEVRAAARLDHPGIVRLYDHGEIPKKLSRLSEGHLPEGAPYLVMEWLGGGSLRTLRGQLPWEKLREVLASLLSALGHAHARDVIHRDLKPDNVLLSSRGPVITDFGSAFAFGMAPADRLKHAVIGTPDFMSPEQVRGDWRTYGPWTDLYAVGCLAYTLATGEPPFARRSFMETFQAHLEDTPPLLPPHAPVPEGFQRWLDRLLHKEPMRRYRFAADAAEALRQLSGEAPAPFELTIDESVDDPTLLDPLFDRDWASESGDEHTVISPFDAYLADDDGERSGPRTRPPVPQTWAQSGDEAPPPPVGAGLALFNLRELPLAGRNRERDTLWSAVRASAEGAGVGCMLIRGPTGQGKTRLAHWLMHRAHETGTAWTFYATHDDPPGPGCGIGPMLARALRCEDLEASDRAARIRGALFNPDPDLVRAVAAALDPTGRFDDGGLPLVISSDQERYEAFAGALAQLSAIRPVVVGVDNLHWAGDALGFILHLLARRPRLPILFVTTLRDDLRGLGADVASRLIDLAQHPATEEIELSPLDEDAHNSLVDAHLPLSPSLSAQLFDRAAGSPLFSQELLRHWISTGALESGPDGYRLRWGSEAELPDELRTLWWQRMQAAVGDLAGGHFFAIELAAVLGMTVEDSEWLQACEHGGYPIEQELFQRLMDGQLVRRDVSGRWAFIHPMIREMFLERAREGGRLVAHHTACATVLKAVVPRDLQRLCRHLLAAGQHEAALEPLLDQAKARIENSDYVGANQAINRRARVLRALGRPLAHPDWIETRILSSEVYRFQGKHALSLRRARKAQVQARALGEPGLHCRSLIALGQVLGISHSPADGWPFLSQAVAVAERSTDVLVQIKALTMAGGNLASHARHAEAAKMLERALTLLEGTKSHWLRGTVLMTIADIARQQGDVQRAGQLAADAHHEHEQAGSRWGQAQAGTLLGDAARYRGELQQAEAHYRRSKQLYAAVGSANEPAADINLGLVLIEQARFSEANLLLSEVLNRLEVAGHNRVSVLVRACLLPCLAHDSDWKKWREYMGQMGLLTSGAVIDPDIAFVARMAARKAVSVGAYTQALAAWRLSLVQFESLGREEEARSVRTEMAVLETKPS